MSDQHSNTLTGSVTQTTEASVGTGRPAIGGSRKWAHSLGTAVRQQDVPLLLVLVLMVVITGAFHPDYLSKFSLINVAREASWIGIMAIGMVFVMSMQEIDLSVGAIYALTIMIAAQLITHGVTPWVAAGLGLLSGIFLGAINGVLVLILKVSSLIVTLGTLSCFEAICYIIGNDQNVVNLPTQNSFFSVFGGDFLGVPISIWVALVLLLVFHIIYRFTRFGFNVRAIGSNKEAARVAGLPINLTKVQGLMLMGGLCGVSGLVTFAYVDAADPTAGTNYNLLVIAAAIIGGTALMGGSGSIIGAIIGSLIMSTITTAVLEFGLNVDWGTFATGAVIIGAVFLDGVFRRRRLRSAERAAHLEASEPATAQEMALQRENRKGVTSAG
jgi:ribose transport system permease protein